jgi:hypothetical protein
MPHEHMYEHARTYYNYYAPPETFYSDACGHHYPGGYGLNKTTVVWQTGCTHLGPSPLTWGIAQKLQYNHANRHYCLGGGAAGYGHHGFGRHGHGFHGHHHGACETGDCGGAAAGNCN